MYVYTIYAFGSVSWSTSSLHNPFLIYSLTSNLASSLVCYTCTRLLMICSIVGCKILHLFNHKSVRSTFTCGIWYKCVIKGNKKGWDREWNKRLAVEMLWKFKIVLTNLWLKYHCLSCPSLLYLNHSNLSTLSLSKCLKGDLVNCQLWPILLMFTWTKCNVKIACNCNIK